MPRTGMLMSFFPSRPRSSLRVRNFRRSSRILPLDDLAKALMVFVNLQPIRPPARCRLSIVDGRFERPADDHPTTARQPMARSGAARCWLVICKILSDPQGPTHGKPAVSRPCSLDSRPPLGTWNGIDDAPRAIDGRQSSLDDPLRFLLLLFLLGVAAGKDARDVVEHVRRAWSRCNRSI